MKLDPKNFNDGQKAAVAAFKKASDEAKKEAKEIEQAAKKSVEFFNKLRDSAVEFLAVFTAGRGFKEFLTDITQADTALGRTARQLDLSAHSLGQWQDAARLVGGSAEGMTGVLSSLTKSMQDFALTGSSSIVGPLRVLHAAAPQVNLDLYDMNGRLRTSADMMLSINQAVQGMDPARAANILSQIFGNDPATIQLMEMAPDKLRQILNLSNQLSPTQRDVSAANQRTFAWQQLLLTWEQVGRTLITNLTPALLSMDNALQKLGDWADTHPRAIETAFLAISGAVLTMSASLAVNAVGAVVALTAKIWGLNTAIATTEATAASGVGGIAGFLGRLAFSGLGAFGVGMSMGLNGVKTPSFDRAHIDAMRRATESNPGAYIIPPGAGGVGANISTGASTGAAASSSDTEAYIRQSAAANGVDPDIAVAVARSEGLGSYIGDAGSSYGPFQLHYGGIAGGGNAVPGLGDDFTRDTGLDARDPSTVRAQIDYVMGYVRRRGWGAFHGAARSGIGNWQGIQRTRPPSPIGAGGSAVINNSSSNRSNTTNNNSSVGSVTINTSSNDGAGIARDFKAAVARSSFASLANYSLA